MKIRQLAVLLIFSSFAVSVQAAFTAGMSAAQIQAEIKLQLANAANKSDATKIDAMLALAKASGVDMSSPAAAEVPAQAQSIQVAVVAAVPEAQTAIVVATQPIVVAAVQTPTTCGGAGQSPC